jgi:hypothetical protein
MRSADGGVSRVTDQAPPGVTMTVRAYRVLALALLSSILGSIGAAGAPAGTSDPGSGQEVSLDGEWELGPGRRYTRTVRVPGLATDPRKVNDAPLWYRRTVRLPGAAGPRQSCPQGPRFARPSTSTG